MIRWAPVVLVIALVTSCGASSDEMDLLFDLATVNAVIAVDPDAILDRGLDEVTERTGAAEAVVDDFFLYEVEPADGLVHVDDVSVLNDDGLLWFYRDPTIQSGVAGIIAGAETVIVALEQRPIVSDQGISVQGRLIGVGADGSVVSSDWEAGPAAVQLDVVADYVTGTGTGWAEALAALASAARDDALDQDIEDPLGADLLEAVRAAG